MRKPVPLLALFILSVGFFGNSCRHKKIASTLDSVGDKPCGVQALALAEAPQPYYFVFPSRLSDYESGSLVLQPKTGRIYRCKPYPYSGFCQQWSPESTQFEPGVGSNWMAAWDVQ